MSTRAVVRAFAPKSMSWEFFGAARCFILFTSCRTHLASSCLPPCYFQPTIRRYRFGSNIAERYPLRKDKDAKIIHLLAPWSDSSFRRTVVFLLSFVKPNSNSCQPHAEVRLFLSRRWRRRGPLGTRPPIQPPDP